MNLGCTHEQVLVAVAVDVAGMDQSKTRIPGFFRAVDGCIGVGERHGCTPLAVVARLVAVVVDTIVADFFDARIDQGFGVVAVGGIFDVPRGRSTVGDRIVFVAVTIHVRVTVPGDVFGVGVDGPVAVVVDLVVADFRRVWVDLFVPVVAI